MPSTCSSRNPSRKSVMLPSALLSASPWRSMIDWLTVFQDDATTARVLELHELLCVFSFFGRRLLEVLGGSRQSDVIPIEVQRHRQVNVVSCCVL